MTEELLKRAKEVQKNIQDITEVLNSVEGIKIIGKPEKRRYQPFIRFLNMVKRKKGKEVLEATTLLFDGINSRGIDVPVDEHLLECIREHFQQRLKEVRTTFDELQ